MFSLNRLLLVDVKLKQMAATKSVIAKPGLSSDNLKLNIWYVLMYYRGSTRSHSYLYVSCTSAACKQCFWTDLLKCSDSLFYICSGSQRGFFSSVGAHMYPFKSSALNYDSLGLCGHYPALVKALSPKYSQIHSHWRLL